MTIINGFPKKGVSSEIPDDKNFLSATEVYPVRRRSTDKCFLFIFGALVLVTLPLIMYTLSHADINRWRGYDNCGNICGQKNAKDPRFSCSGVDYTNLTYLSDSECTKLPEWLSEYSFQSDMHEELSGIAGTLLVASLFTIGLTTLLALGFTYIPYLTVVAILVISWGYLVVATVIFSLWCVFYNIMVPLIYGALSVITLCVLIYKIDEIKLAIKIFKESSKVIANTQTLIPVPIMTLLMLITLVIVSGTAQVHMASAGMLQSTGYTRLEYVKDGWMIAALVLNAILTFWTVQIMLGLQNMAISSAVSKWYSSRGPVTTNYWTILNNHLGSVLLGSTVMNWVSIPRTILIGLSQISIFKNMVSCFLRCLNGFYYSYIFTASQGSSFLKSSKKARQLLNLKVAETTGVQSMGGFVMLLSQILIACVSALAYRGVFYNRNPFSMVVYYYLIVLSLLCYYTLLGPIRVAYDTLFICACEDILKEGHQHDSMSIEEFQSNARKVLEKKVRKMDQPLTAADAVA